jgi:hypothetical protein
MDDVIELTVAEILRGKPMPGRLMKFWRVRFGRCIFRRAFSRPGL